MQLIPKEITLEKDIMNDIKNNNIDTNRFINLIKNYLNKANYLIKNNMEKMSDVELYNYLKEIFSLKYSREDYYKILSRKYNKHYTRIDTIYTYMFKDDYNVSYSCLIDHSNRSLYNKRVPLSEIRKLTNSYDIIVLEEEFTKLKEDEKIKKKEKYENHKFVDVDINNDTIKESDELFPIAIELIKEQIKIKDILYYLDLYIKEVKYQAKKITHLAFQEDNKRLANIGKQYKKAYDQATTNHELKMESGVVLTRKSKKNSRKYH